MIMMIILFLVDNRGLMDLAVDTESTMTRISRICIEAGISDYDVGETQKLEVVDDLHVLHTYIWLSVC